MDNIDKKVGALKQALTKNAHEIDVVWEDRDNSNPWAKDVVLPIGKGYTLEGLGSNGEVFVKNKEGGSDLEGFWHNREKKPNLDSSVGGYIRSVRIKLFSAFIDKINHESEIEE